MLQKIARPIALSILVASFGGFAAAQQNNSVNASLDVNGASMTGSAPYAATIELPGPVVATISGSPNLPFALFAASGLQVGQTIFDGTRQIDIGPSLVALVDGISGPYDQFFGITNASGTRVLQALASPSTMTGVVDAAVQAVVVDPSLPPFNVGISAATTLTYSPDGPGNSAPLCDAGPDQIAVVATCGSLDGTGSVDPEASGLTYSWVQTGGPMVSFFGATTATPFVIYPQTAATLTFELTVNDGTTDSAPDEVIIDVQNPSTPSFRDHVIPIVECLCVGCHGVTNVLDMSGGVANATNIYAAMTAMVANPNADAPAGPRANPASPSTSPIPNYPTTVTGMSLMGTVFPGGTSDPAYLVLLAWVTQGAQNN
ncbi:MAG: hypothetical protein R3F20_12715 [Planctomycetota bacterium]